MSLSLSQRQIGDVLVIDMIGQLTVYDEDLRDTVRRYIEGGGRRLVLNLAGLSYLDSAGLGKLITAYVSMNNAGGEIRLLSPGSRTRQLLQITKLDTVFVIIDDEKAIRGATSAA